MIGLLAFEKVKAAGSLGLPLTEHLCCHGLERAEVVAAPVL